VRVVVVGLGVQGHKRRAVAAQEVVATVDPANPEAQYERLEDVPLSDYDAALVCTPDEAKLGLLTHLLENRKHLLVEKPLFAGKRRDLERLKALASKGRVTCYTAYNHRFEPHFVRMKELFDSGRLGKIYCIRMFYGNGTARLVRDSAWRDSGAGVLPDLGSHLLDTVLFWLGRTFSGLRVQTANRFENRAFDHVAFGANGDPVLQFEATLLSWRNHHYTDVFAEKGSAHIESLCKWGPSKFTVRARQLPSGRPSEEAVTLVQPDPTWAHEYEHFKKLCARGESNIDNDIWINDSLAELSRQALEEQPR
jgi:scyllo-inositol 2-dehydrogenase (NADP+)